MDTRPLRTRVRAPLAPAFAVIALGLFALFAGWGLPPVAAQEVDVPSSLDAEVVAIDRSDDGRRVDVSLVVPGSLDTGRTVFDIVGDVPPADVDLRPLDVPPTVLLLIDTSGSMAGQRLIDAKAAALECIGRIPDYTLLGLIAYADEPTHMVEPSLERTELGPVIEGLEALGETATFDTVIAATQLVDEADVSVHDRASRFIVLLSDGEDSVSAATSIDAVAELEASAFQLHSLAIAPDGEFVSTLETLTSRSGGHLVVGAAEDLGQVCGSVAARLNSRYHLGVTFDEPTQADFEVKVSRDDGTAVVAVPVASPPGGAGGSGASDSSGGGSNGASGDDGGSGSGTTEAIESESGSGTGSGSGAGAGTGSDDAGGGSGSGGGDQSGSGAGNGAGSDDATGNAAEDDAGAAGGSGDDEGAGDDGGGATSGVGAGGIPDLGKGGNARGSGAGETDVGLGGSNVDSDNPSPIADSERTLRLWTGAGAVVGAPLIALLVLAPRPRVQHGLRIRRLPRAGLVARLSMATTMLLERRQWNQRLDRRLELAALSLSAGEFVVFIGLGAAIPAMVLMLLGLSASAIVTLISVPVIANLWIRRRGRQRAAKFQEQLGDTLMILSGAIKSGNSTVQALAATAEKAPSPNAEEFQRVVAEARIGRDLIESLHDLADRMDSEDTKWVVEAIALNRELGGNLSSILDNVAATMRARAEVRSQVKVLSAEGRLTAVILLGLPFGVAGMLQVINPGYLSVLFTERSGNILLAVDLGLMLVGGLWVKKMINLEY